MKCKILEQKFQISAAISLAENCILDCSNEFEFDQANRDMIPKFKALVADLKPKVSSEREWKTDQLEKDVEAQLSNMGDFTALDKLFTDANKQ